MRDSWRVDDRLRLDGGVRVDWTSLGGGAVPSARLGARYALGAGTAVSGTVGEFVGTIPLLVPAFGGFPVRTDTTFDPASATALGSAVLAPSVSDLALPRARVLSLRVERHLAEGWDVLVGGSLRRASRLATLDVRAGAGALAVTSTGASRYHELEVAARHTWGDGNEAFVSYTRSSVRGNLNDFSSLFAFGDVEVLRPDATGRLAADAPNRWLGWSTFMLPRGFILAPAMEWHSGFPYSTLDAARAYAGVPAGSSYPAFFSLDVGVFKTVDVRGRRVKAGVQIFNATNHFNPREVYAVPGAPQFGTFTNSVGPTLRGVLTFLW